jgi:hypothetical protein
VTAHRRRRARGEVLRKRPGLWSQDDHESGR